MKTMGSLRPMWRCAQPLRSAFGCLRTSKFMKTDNSIALGISTPFRVYAAQATEIKIPEKYDFKTLYTENYLGLRRIPVPPLADTCSRYLRSVEPLVSAEEFEVIKREVREFETGPGPQLQDKLVAEDQHEGYPYSYIQKHWDDMYMGLRCPHPINISPFFKITDDPDPAKSHLRRAAEFARGFALWTRKVLAGTLEPDVDGKGTPQCSTSFALMFSSNKTPYIGRDVIEQHTEARNITVVSKGNLFSIEVISESGEIISANLLESLLQEAEATPAAPVSLCALTGEDRDVWAKARSSLSSHNPENAAALKEADQGILCVCLDEEPPADMSALGQSVLTGPKRSRWYDKQQLLVYPNAKMAMLFEHSYSDGLGWARFIHEVMCDSLGMQKKLPANVAPLPQLPKAQGPLMLKKLEFDIPSELKAVIETAEKNYDTLAAGIETQVLEFKHFGKNEFKTWKVSPDAAVQMAYQVAYYKVHGCMPPVYESCATRKFFHGRTETIRSTTPDSWALCRAVVDGDTSTGRSKLDLLRAAAATHSTVSRDAASALGCDRHLMVLNYIANRDSPSNIPAIFTNPAFTAAKTWMLSTSNASSTPFIDLFGFGPVASDGYGCGYLIGNDWVTVNISSFKGTASKGSKTLHDAIESTLLEFKALADAEQN